MIEKTKVIAIVGAVAGSLVLGSAAGAADYTTRELQVVGTWGNLDHWKSRESKLWNKMIPDASGGAIKTNAKPNTELGLSGFEVMRLLKLGTYDFAHFVTSYIAGDSPAVEGIDLAGVFQSMEQFREGIEVYKPIMDREFKRTWRSQVLMYYPWPSQQLWCNLGDKSMTDVALADLKGKKVRTYNTTLGDFIEGFGGSAVTIAFAEVVPALQKGVADCGITGTEPAYNAKWYQVVTHNVRVRLGYVASALAVNIKVWRGLTEDTRTVISEQVAKMEEEMWTETAKLDQAGMDCNASGPCPLGDELGGMVPIEPDAKDKKLMAEIIENYVLKRWAKRCGAECAEEWSNTLGKFLGYEAKI